MDGYNRIVSTEEPLIQPAMPEIPLDLTVYVNRAISPIYPLWKKKLKNPELEHSGLERYLLSELPLLVLEEQRKKIVDGYLIYNCLKKTSIISSCANLQDGYAILEKGIKVFLKLFGINALLFLGSVAVSDDEKERVPYLFPHNGNLLLYWRDLSDSFGENAITVLLPKQE